LQLLAALPTQISPLQPLTTRSEDDVFLSYLPLAHIFGRVAEEAFLVRGGSIGYWQGSAKLIMDDIAALRPTLFVGVPRIFDRIYSGVTAQARGAAGGGGTQ